MDAGRDPPRTDHATPAVAACPDRQKPNRGIFRVDGDVLAISCAEGDRPTAFEAPAGPKVLPIRYRRVKKG